MRLVDQVVASFVASLALVPNDHVASEAPNETPVYAQRVPAMPSASAKTSPKSARVEGTDFVGFEHSLALML